ncbi:hypothetical protein [Streptomyces sp. NRRL B-24085]|nr:hypothetical protein [Streptomyces sp. NRRL B-24085]
MQIFRAERTTAVVMIVDTFHTVAVDCPGDVARAVDEAVRATG